ncbi:putative cytochrome P450 [Helianthus debilis subsp. tardiflorus]
MEMTSFLLIFFFFLLIYSFFFLFNPTNSKSTLQPGFKHYPIFGTLPEFLLNRHRFLDWSTQVLSQCPTSTAVFSRPGKVNGVITANPANVEHMLKTNFENYPKGTRFISLLEDFLGRGIFNSDGETWRAQRKTASYEFNTRSLRNFVMETAAVELHTRFVPVLERAAALNKVVDLQDLLERYSFDNICKVAFNFDPGCLAGDGTSGSEFMKAFEEAATLSSGRFMYVLPGLYKIKKLLNFGSESKLQKSIATVHKFADDIIQSRITESAKEPNDDLLSRFMDISEYSPEFLRDIVISFILAGRDTTSSALTWFFWILSSHPEVKLKILEELKTLRLSKSDQNSYEFDDLRQFRPERWLEEENGGGTVVYRPENPFKYPVFHGGARVCLGKEMAYTQMKLVAATIMEVFEVELEVVEKKVPEHVLSLTMRMKDGLKVRVRKR